MPEGSGVLFKCRNEGCDYETLLFPEEPAQRPKWLSGHELPTYECPVCKDSGVDGEEGLGDLFSTEPDRDLIPAEAQP